MPYLKIWIHLIWATKNREPVLRKELRQKVFTHIRENAREKGIHLDFINGYIDHVHALVSLNGEQSIGKVAQMLKGESSHWINAEQLTMGRFEWQEEYLALSVSESLVDKVREYIKKQEEHHKNRSFGEEYQEFMERSGFEFHGG